jgi:AraC family transcriptional regulator, L-rhamnose operon transcriptional activator RhaR
MAGNSAEPGRSVTSKIVAILLTFHDGNEHSLTEIARLTCLPVSTAHRLVTDLPECSDVDTRTERAHPGHGGTSMGELLRRHSYRKTAGFPGWKHETARFGSKRRRHCGRRLLTSPEMTLKRTDCETVVGDLPMDTSGALFHFNDHALTYAGPFQHDKEEVLHSHSFVEITFVLSGEGVHRSIAGRQPLFAGDVTLMRPGLWHGYDECRRLALYNCCFSSELLLRELAWTREDPMLGYLLWTGPFSDTSGGMLTVHLEPEAIAECQAQLAALQALWQLPVLEYRGDIVGQLALLLSTLARAVARVYGLPRDGVEITHPAVGQAIRLLETRLADHWTLTGLADDLYLAPGYLLRLFKAATGLPPMAYLARQRTECAADLLLHSDDSIAYIGRAVGWPDQNYFARRFRAHYGLSPTTYRAKFSARPPGYFAACQYR